MANNQPCVSGTEAACEALCNIIARALGYPKRGTGSPVLTWNGVGNVPRGWTKRPTTTWLQSQSICAVPIPSDMQTELQTPAAQARLTPADRASLASALAVIATVNLDTYGSKSPGDQAFPMSVVPSFGIAWDGWGSDHTRIKNVYVSTGDSPNNVWVDYPHRKPSGWASFDLWSFPGDTYIDPQSRVDWRLQDLSGVIDAISYDWYPHPKYFPTDPQNIPDAGYIGYGLECHRVSQYKSLVKMMVMLDPGWWGYGSGPAGVIDWTRAATYRADLIALMSDPDYFRVLGRPVIGVYGYAALSASNKTQWQAEMDAINTDCIAAIGVAPYYVAQDNSSTAATDLKSRGLRWKTTYGPNPSLPSYNANLPTTGALSQYPFLTGIQWDRAKWGSPGGGIQLACSLTPNLDGRCRGNGNRAYVDDPVFLELLEHANAANAAFQTGIGKAEITSVYSVSEHSEGGSFVSTDQDGSKFGDALRVSRGVLSPSTYTEKVDAHLTLFTKTGTWTYVQSLGTSYYNSDVMRSGGTGSKLSYSHYQITKLEAALERGPNKGIANIYLDGSLVAVIDCYNATALPPAILWSSSDLTPGLHTIDVEESASKNSSSTGFSIGLDYVRSTVSLLFT